MSSTTSTSSNTSTTPPKVNKSRIPPVLTWSDPVRSGLVFGEILAALFVIRYGNLLRLSLKLCCYAIGVTSIVEFATRYFNGSKQGMVSNYKPSRFISINQHSVEKYTNRTIRWASEGVYEVKKIFDAEDLSLSAIAFFVCGFLYILTGFVSVSSLCFIAAIAAFSLPRLYLQFQPQIDEVVDQVQSQACTQYENVSSQVSEAATPHLQKARSHVEQYAGKFGLNLNRGGFPSNDKSPLSDSVPTVAASAAAQSAAANSKPETIGTTDAAGATTGVENDAKLGADDDVAPVSSLSEDQRTVDDVTYDKVPTMMGNVDLTEKPAYPNPVAGDDSQAPAVDSVKSNLSTSASELAEDLKKDAESATNF